MIEGKTKKMGGELSGVEFFFFGGGRGQGEGGTNERAGTDHEISGPIRGLKKCTRLRKDPNIQTSRRTWRFYD